MEFGSLNQSKQTPALHIYVLRSTEKNSCLLKQDFWPFRTPAVNTENGKSVGSVHVANGNLLAAIKLSCLSGPEADP